MAVAAHVTFNHLNFGIVILNVHADEKTKPYEYAIKEDDRFWSRGDDRGMHFASLADGKSMFLSFHYMLHARFKEHLCQCLCKKAGRPRNLRK